MIKRMKLKSPITAALCIAAVALLGPGSALAAPTKSASPGASPSPAASAAASAEASPAAKARAIPFRGTVSAVDTAASTFTLARKKGPRVFKVTDKTNVVKDGAPGTMADIVADEFVTGSFWKKGDGILEAKKVKIGGKSSKASRKKSKKAEADASATMSPSPSASPQ